MSDISKIIYVSRKSSDGQVAPGFQQLFLYDANDDLIWLGTRAVTDTLPSAIHKNSEWNSAGGSWDVVFAKGGPAGETYPTPADTSTASVSGTVVKPQGGSAGYITFVYGGKKYKSVLTGYNTDEARFPLGDVTVDPSYIIYVPYTASDYGLPTSQSLSSVGRNAYMLDVDDDWTVTKPTVQATTVSPGTSVDVAWTALTPENTDSNKSIISTLIYLDYSTNSDMTSATSVALSGTSGTQSVTGLAKNQTYYFQIRASWTTNEYAELENTSNIDSAETKKTLLAPSVASITALDGEGSVTWGTIPGAAGYLLALVDSPLDTPSSSSPVNTTSWSFNETASGTTVQGKYVKLKSVATANSIEYENSEWSDAVLIPDNRTPAGDDPDPTPVELIMTRRIYKAIPYIDVPVEQIGANGSSLQDVITVEYADNHYMPIDGSVPAGQLPWTAAYGTQTDTATNVVVNPKYVKDAIAAIDVVQAITEIKVSGDSGAKNISGIQLGSGETATSTTTIKLPSKKYVEDTYVAKTQFATSSGGSGNAGIVWVNSTSGADGLVIDSTNAGRIKVNFASTSGTGWTWEDTTTSTVANPAYVKAAIEGWVSANVATSGANKILKVGSDGKISDSVLPSLAITDTFEASSQAAMLALSDAKKGDVCIRSDINKSFILSADGYSTLANWKELKTPTDAVLSVNGKTGAVTLALTDVYSNGSTTSVTSGSDALVTSGAVATAISNLNLGTAATYSVASWTANTTHWDTGGTGLVTANYLKSAITDYGFGAAAKKGLATSVSSSDTGLVTGAQVYNAIDSNISNLEPDDIGAAAETHYHGLADITYTGSGNSRTGYSAGTTISSSSTAGQLATAKAVYDYQPLITRIKATAAANFSAVTTDLSTTINSENFSIPTAYAVQQALAGKAASSHNQSIVTILAAGSEAFSGTLTSFSNYSANAEDWYVPTAYAVKTALAGKADSSHTHTSSQISDAISTVSDPSASSTFGKVVKTQSDWGNIDGKLIPIDEDSIVLNSSGYLRVDGTYLYNTLDGRYLKSATAATTYLTRNNVDASVWTSGTSYTVGQMVFSGTSVWRCIQANTASFTNQPGSMDSGNNYVYWVPVKVEFSSRYETTLTRTSSDANTYYDITHNLGSKYVEVQLFDSSDREVFAAVTPQSASVVRISFGAAATASETYKVVVRR